MGDPKHIRKKYSKPMKMWDAERLEEEKPIVKEYGLKNKREIWKARSLLKKFKIQAKRLTSLRTEQAALEKKQLLTKLHTLGLLQDSATLDDVLKLSLKDFLSRRLQTLLFKKALAHSVSQARQFIVHRHVMVDGQVVTSPAYLVPIASEPTIAFAENSSLAKPDHPKRVVKTVKVAP